MPILEAKDNTEKWTEKFKIAARKTFHKCLEVLLNPLLKLNNNGIHLTLNGEIIWFHLEFQLLWLIGQKL